MYCKKVQTQGIWFKSPWSVNIIQVQTLLSTHHHLSGAVLVYWLFVLCDHHCCPQTQYWTLMEYYQRLLLLWWYGGKTEWWLCLEKGKLGKRQTLNDPRSPLSFRTSSWKHEGIQDSEDEKKNGSMLNLWKVRGLLLRGLYGTNFAPNICRIGPDIFSTNSARTRRLSGRWLKDIGYKNFAESFKTYTFPTCLHPKPIHVFLPNHVLVGIGEKSISVNIHIVNVAGTWAIVVMYSSIYPTSSTLENGPVWKSRLGIFLPTLAIVMLTKVWDRFSFRS